MFLTEFSTLNSPDTRSVVQSKTLILEVVQTTLGGDPLEPVVVTERKGPPSNCFERDYTNCFERGRSRYRCTNSSMVTTGYGGEGRGGWRSGQEKTGRVLSTVRGS